MKATVNYQEISSFALNKYNKEIDILKVAEKTIKISYNPGRLAPNIIVDVSIANVSNNVIDFKYEFGAEYSKLGRFGLSSMLDFVNKKVLSLQKYIPKGFEVNTDERTVKVYLSKLEEFKKALEFVTLSNISFLEDSVSISLKLL